MHTLHPTLIQKQYKSGEIEIQVKIQQLPTSDLYPFLDPQRFNSYCREGCPNHSKKWTCPPYCPPFEEYSQYNPFTCLILFCCKVNQFPQAEGKDRSLEVYNFTKETLQAWLREQETKTGGKMIAANSCEICKTCSVEHNNPCHFPDQHRYNLVAFGFNVNSILETYFDHKIQWSEANKEPEYVTSVGALLFDRSVPEELLSDLIR
ncbi:MAG: DUF2284 domain-containing protein [Marinifilaceae bacterium]